MPKAFQSEKILMDPERTLRAGVRKVWKRGKGGSIESKAFVRRIVKKKKKRERSPLPFPLEKIPDLLRLFSRKVANFHRPFVPFSVPSREY